MMVFNLFLCAILASACYFGTAYSFEWPSSIPKCKPGDEACIPQALTKLIQHASEFPDLNIPKLDPLVMKKPTTLRTRNPNVNFVIHNSNVIVYGLNKLEIKQVKGFGPDPKNTKLEVKSFVPSFTSVANYKSTMNIFALPITSEGVSNTTIKNVELRQIIDFDVVERAGKEYIKIKEIHVRLKLNNFAVHFKSKNNNPTIDDTINTVINENWRDIYAELKPDLEQHVGEVIKSIMAPIFDRIPYQDFFS